MIDDICVTTFILHALDDARDAQFEIVDINFNQGSICYISMSTPVNAVTYRLLTCHESHRVQAYRLVKTAPFGSVEAVNRVT